MSAVGGLAPCVGSVGCSGPWHFLQRKGEALGCASDEDRSTDHAAELLLELAARDRAAFQSAFEGGDTRARIKKATANALIVERAARAIRIALQKSYAGDADVAEQAQQRP